MGLTARLAPDSLAAIACPVLVMAADRDAISIEHTVAIRDAIPGARLCIVPGATHCCSVNVSAR